MMLLKHLLLPGCAVLLMSQMLLVGYAGAQPAAAAAAGNPLPTLSAEQQRAIGIVIAAAPAANLPRRIDAFGRVLDPARLVADAGRLDSSRAAADAAAAETARLKGLYRGADTSLKTLQLAQAAQIEAQARVREAQAEFLLRWGPLAQLGEARRATLIGQLAAGRQLLLRADLPGRHSLGLMPKRALVDVDGVQVPALVLGPLPQAAARLQSVGLLLQIPHPPAGLGPSAQLPVILEAGARDGRIVPNGALLYGRKGVYVFRALPQKTKEGATEFAQLPVRLLQPVGGGWLVTGLQRNDRIVVRGAGALWSLRGLGGTSVDED